MQRVMIVGGPGSGRSTVAVELGHAVRRFLAALR